MRVAEAAGAAGGSVDVGSFDQECDADVGPVLIEVLPADAGGDDVHSADVAQGARSLLEGLLSRIVTRRLRASHQLDDLHYRHLVLLESWSRGAAAAAPTIWRLRRRASRCPARAAARSCGR